MCVCISVLVWTCEAPLLSPLSPPRSALLCGPLWNQEVSDRVKGDGAKDNSAETEKNNKTGFWGTLRLPRSQTQLSHCFLSFPHSVLLIAPALFVLFSPCFLYFPSLLPLPLSRGLAFLSSTFQPCVCESACVCWEGGQSFIFNLLKSCVLLSLYLLDFMQKHDDLHLASSLHACV